MGRHSYEIITDTCANFKESEIEEFDIKVIGFPYTVNGEESTDDPRGETIETKDVYALLRKKCDVKTSLINSAAFEEFFEEFLKEGKDILYICISGGISGTYQNAINAKNILSEKYPDRQIFVVDSLSGSYSQGILVIKTVLKRNAGATVSEAFEYACRLRNHITHDFTIDDLFYLKKSGRVSNSTALVGTIMMIKPMFTLDKEGKLIVYKKINGRKKALNSILENFKKNIDKNEADFIGIVHGDCEDEALTLKKSVSELFPNARVLLDYLTPLVGAHAGPGAIGLLYISKENRI